MRSAEDRHQGQGRTGARAVAGAVASGLLLVLGACGGAQPAATPTAAAPATPSAPGGTASPTSPASPSAGASSSVPTTPSATLSPSPPAADAEAVTVPITVKDGRVSPNGDRVDVRVGQPVVLEVTSDTDDELHAHTDGDGYALEVTAGTPTTGRFTIGSPGRYEVESHHLGKIILVLDVR